MNGHSWADMVVETPLRGFENFGSRMKPYHFRTRGGAEIDLILEGEAGLIPVEIKLGTVTDVRPLRALREFIAAHDCALGLVINNDDKPRQFDAQIVALPAASL